MRCLLDVTAMILKWRIRKTQTALERTISRTVSTRGVVIRQESVLPSVASGTVVPAITNGSKVSQGDTVASVFSSASDAANILRLREVEKDISYYENIESLSFGSMYTDIETYRHNISKSLYAVTDLIESNHLSLLGDSLQELSLWTTRRQISTGTVVDVSEPLSRLESLRNRYNGAYGDSRLVTADRSGYYVNIVDGFESKTDYEAVLTMSTAEVQTLLDQTPQTGNAYVGKLITEFNWYYVCIAPEKETDPLRVGSTVTLTFPSMSVPNMKMTLRAKNPDGTGNTALVFSSNLMNAEVASLRLENAEILLESFTGFQVDMSALRKVDGVDGVYVQVGNIVQFRKAKKIYAENDIILIGAEEGVSAAYAGTLMAKTDATESATAIVRNLILFFLISLPSDPFSMSTRTERVMVVPAGLSVSHVLSQSCHTQKRAPDQYGHWY